MSTLIGRAAAVLLFALLGAPPSVADSSPAPILFHAAQSGQRTLDAGDGGGNPFASALIEVLARGTHTLLTFAAELADLTSEKSSGFQSADIRLREELFDWHIAPKPEGETRIALVIAISGYAASGGAPSLPGAKADASRVSAAFTVAGFDTKILIDPSRTELEAALLTTSQRSANADVAAIYATGHGVEVDGAIYLLPGDFPVAEGNAALRERAVPLAHISGSARSKRVNLVFYGGCRDNPFGGP